MIRSFAGIFVVALGAALVASNASWATEPPLELKWAQLVPAATPSADPPAPAKQKSFLSGMTPKPDDGSPAPPPLDDGKFMSMKRRQPGGDRPPAIVAELNGKRVSIGGYVVPLDFESTSIKEFLLVPFVGACIHVPPPPTNQIIYVKIEKGLEVTGPFDPVTVIGTLKTETSFTGLADAGYSLDADTVEILKP